MCRWGQSCATEARDVLSADLRAAVDAERHGSAKTGAAVQRRLTRDEEKRLLPRLLRLRQACCHPQVGCAATQPGVPTACGNPHAALPSWGNRLSMLLSVYGVRCECVMPLSLTDPIAFIAFACWQCRVPVPAPMAFPLSSQAAVSWHQGNLST